MRAILASSLVVACSALFAAGSAQALSVSPTLIEVVATDSSSSRIVVRNDGTTPADVQVRALRWTQAQGEDRLERTDAVVVSPPIAKLAPGQEQTIRVVRLSKAPIRGEEAYRLLVDQLPAPSSRASNNVSFLVRQSVPVFFRSPQASAAPLTFALGGGGQLVGVNRGDTYHKVIALNARDGSGRAAISKQGLVGYVLGGSQYAFPASRASGDLAVSGRTTHGAFEGVARR